MSSELMRLAVTVEETYAYGRSLGLSREDCAEVMRAWEGWYRQRPWPLDWARVHGALIRRAAGNSWRP